jgi:hypothetical protein
MGGVRRPAALVIAAYATLGLVWAITNAPFAAPDEAAHYLRAVGISDGRLVGTRASDPNPALTTKQRAWTDQATRMVTVPPGLSPGATTPCEAGHPALSAACSDHAAVNPTAAREVTSVGTYEPLPYLLPAAVVRVAGHAAGADRAARIATFAVWLAMVAAAVWMLWDETAGGMSLAGLLVAVTPMVVFIGASLTGSSVEIMSSITFFAALLRLTRDPNRVPLGAFAVAAVSGAVLALSRSPGPGWVALDLIVWAPLAGRAAIVALWRRFRPQLLIAAVVILAGIGANRYWEATYGPRVLTSLFPPLESLKAGGRELFGALDELVGRFGYLDTPLGAFGVSVWALLSAGLLGAAAWFGRARERWALGIAVAVSLLGPIYLFAAITRFTGFGLQGRHVLALIVTLPLVAGEIVRRRRPAPVFFAAVAAGVGAIQLVAWWVNSRRYAVGDQGPLWFLSHPHWSPPAGWIVWTLLAAAAAMTLAVSGVPRRRAKYLQAA